MWSNQDTEEILFASRPTWGSSPAWTAPEVAFDGHDAADDHINLAAVQERANMRMMEAVGAALRDAARP